MSTDILTLADMLHELGDIPPSRIRWQPYPGTATEKDLLRLMARGEKLLELVDGILVEKAMSLKSSLVAAALIYFLKEFLERNDLGLVAGEAGTIRLTQGLIRIPDVAFYSWQLFPGREVPDEPIPNLAPSLAVEVLSKSNRPGEMHRKYAEYFAFGVRWVWEIDPATRTAKLYSATEDFEFIDVDGILEGGEVLPGFRLTLKRLFASAGQHGTRKPANGTRRKPRFLMPDSDHQPFHSVVSPPREP